ncbi:glycosyl transferase family 2 [Halanaerobium saccharolyticum]|uniref:Glycosyl transferase family 2 n=1 Tax=Halanaerobium saccharolyticum TaxID=43595 RepID=A0A4R7Z3G6_9FIRM|nr:glycosyltransferase [Halanaerobium saccharolyticum]RAK12618.1 glycosyl transferase family 2 [Halanaerobium saccharolyticum]TDW05470.1 glycosyl transferase family 2 [Halanaerobium saccharolyticum]TDX62985.1 glycosyl transferase family 2 [Halanaerobium saccharolyticum]
MISVIMSVYNAEKYLEKAVESILTQSYHNFEFIIINDKSKDNSADIISKYADQDQRIKYIENERNRGLTYSLNKGLELAKGEYIARMDADDISTSDRLKKQVDYLKKNKEISLIGTSAYNIDENGKIIAERNVPLEYEEIKRNINLVNPIIHPSVMFKKKDILDIGGYNEEFKKVQDYELWFRIIANGLKVENLSERLLYYRVNNQYFERKSLSYRITDIKVRWRGYKLLSLPIYKRYGILVPIVLGITPPFILKVLYKYLKRLDPRN